MKVIMRLMIKKEFLTPVVMHRPNVATILCGQYLRRHVIQQLVGTLPVYVYLG
jgi:hypothetical protein